jgi:outer membrane protein TolC
MAMMHRIDGQLARSQVDAAEQELRLEVLKVFPNVEVGATLERPDNRALPGRKILADTARASVRNGQPTAPDIQTRAERALERRQIIDSLLGPSITFTLPIWDQNQAQIAKACFRAVQARKKFEDLLDQVYEEVQQTSQTARSDRQLLKFYNEQLLPQLQANVEASRQIYLAGQQSVLVLLDAQRSLVSRRKDYVNVLRDYALAMADLERAVGGRLPSSTTTAPASAPASSGPARP